MCTASYHVAEALLSAQSTSPSQLSSQRLLAHESDTHKVVCLQCMRCSTNAAAHQASAALLSQLCALPADMHAVEHAHQQGSADATSDFTPQLLLVTAFLVAFAGQIVQLYWIAKCHCHIMTPAWQSSLVWHYVAHASVIERQHYWWPAQAVCRNAVLAVPEARCCRKHTSISGLPRNLAGSYHSRSCHNKCVPWHVVEHWLA